MTTALMVVSSPASALPPNFTSPVRVFAARGAPAHDLAVDVLGKVHVAVEGGTQPGIWYVTDAGGGWTSERLTSGADRWPSIAVEDGVVTIAFARTDPADRGIFTITDWSGAWESTKRHTGADGAPSLAVHAGIGHVAFQAPGTALRYLRGAVEAPTDQWAEQTVDGSCCTAAPSLAVTSGGAARVAYGDGTPSAPSGLKLAIRAGDGTWSKQVVDRKRSSVPWLVLDESDRPHIAYVRRGSGTMYANKGTGPWGFRGIDAAASGPPALSVHSGSVAFTYGNAGALRYATLSGGIIFGYSLSATKGDRAPHILRSGGKPIVTFVRSNGGTKDGVLLTHQR